MAKLQSLLLVSTSIAATTAYFVELVDTRIGSGGSAYGDGSVNPGAQYPFGALRLGPDSTLYADGDFWASFDHFGGYHFNDTHIRAFSHTHTDGAGVNDWGNVGVTMVRGLTQQTIHNSTAAAAYVSAFSHSNETAQPGYYAVTLETHSVYAELTASGTHTGAHRYTCMPPPTGLSGNNSCILLVDVCHTSSLPGACKVANVSIASVQGTNGSNVLVITASVLNNGALTGRGPYGGVWLHWYGETELTAGQGPAPATFGLWANDVLYPAVANGGPSTATRGAIDNLGAWVNYGIPNAPSNSMSVTLRVGLSFIDPAHAKQNLYADQAVPSAHPLHQSSLGGPWATDFTGLVSIAQSTWEQWLSRTQVTPLSAAGDAYPVLRTFTAAAYRALLAPTTYSEWDGAYMGMDQQMHAILYANGSTAGIGNTKAAPLYRYMSDMSLWDTHRTQGPWLSLVAPDVAADTVRSLLTMTGQGGHLPRWPMANVYTECMDGSHGIAVMADAYLKCTPGVAIGSPDGTNGSILPAIYNVTYTAVEAQAKGNRYAALGYVPAEDSDTAASTTLEYAFDDGISALLANASGLPAQAAAWVQRSKNYANVWDFNTSTVCPRKADGTFSCPLSKWIPYPINSGYTEGNGAQWQWYAPHDLPGLLAHAYAGNGTAYSLDLHQLMADQLLWPFVAAGISDVLPNFAYWAGNEPDLLAPWQFNAAGPAFAWLTQFWTRWLVRFYYIASPDGVPGNDDYGTMSAWAAWSMLGIYPLAGTNTWMLGSPSILNATLGLPGATALVIQIHNATDAVTGSANRFVSSVTINGRPLSTPMVRFADLMPSRAAPCGQAPQGSGAGLLEFTMTDTPMEWGTGRVLSPAELAPFPLPAWPAGVPVSGSGDGDKDVCKQAKLVLGPAVDTDGLCGQGAVSASVAAHLRRKLHRKP